MQILLKYTVPYKKVNFTVEMWDLSYYWSVTNSVDHVGICEKRKCSVHSYLGSVWQNPVILLCCNSIIQELGGLGSPEKKNVGSLFMLHIQHQISFKWTKAYVCMSKYTHMYTYITLLSLPPNILIAINLIKIYIKHVCHSKLSIMSIAHNTYNLLHRCGKSSQHTVLCSPLAAHCGKCTHWLRILAFESQIASDI